MEDFPGMGKATVNVRISEDDSWFPTPWFGKWSIEKIRVENPGNFFTSSDEQMLFWKNETGKKCALLFCLDNPEEVTVPDGVTVISGYAFSKNHLRAITLPDSITTIRSSAFAGCKDLRAVKLPAHLKYIEDSAFSSCGIESLTLPSSLKRVEDRAFSGCKHLRDVCLEGNEESLNLSPSAFFNCPNLVNVPQDLIPVPVRKTGIFARFMQHKVSC